MTRAGNCCSDQWTTKENTNREKCYLIRCIQCRVVLSFSTRIVVIHAPTFQSNFKFNSKLVSPSFVPSCYLSLSSFFVHYTHSIELRFIPSYPINRLPLYQLSLLRLFLKENFDSVYIFQILLSLVSSFLLFGMITKKRRKERSAKRLN